MPKLTKLIRKQAAKTKMKNFKDLRPTTQNEGWDALRTRAVTEASEAWLSQHTPHKGHAYHTKSNVELQKVMKDSAHLYHTTGRKEHHEDVDRAATILAYRKKGGKQRVTVEEFDYPDPGPSTKPAKPVYRKVHVGDRRHITIPVSQYALDKEKKEDDKLRHASEMLRKLPRLRETVVSPWIKGIDREEDIKADKKAQAQAKAKKLEKWSRRDWPDQTGNKLKEEKESIHALGSAVEFPWKGTTKSGIVKHHSSHDKYWTGKPYYSVNVGGSTYEPQAHTVKAKHLKEQLTPRERMSEHERLTPIKKNEGSEKNIAAHDRKTLDMMQTMVAKRPKLKEENIVEDTTLHENWKAIPSVTMGGKSHFHIRHTPQGKEKVMWHRQHLKWEATRNDQTHGLFDSAEQAKKHFEKEKARLHEETETYKVGDRVVPKIGPHKGQMHRVIHVHPSGHLNIKPQVHVSRNRYRLGAAKADPKDVVKMGKEIHNMDWGGKKKLEEAKKGNTYYQTMMAAQRKPGTKADISHLKPRSYDPDCPSCVMGDKSKVHVKLRGHLPILSRKTVQEAFQAAKDKKKGENPFVKKDNAEPQKELQDNLPNEGANEPNKEQPGIPPQFGKKDGGPEEKKSNTPEPEKKGTKIKVKGAGPDDRFQPEPIVTPLTVMPDTSSPKSGSQGVR